MSSKTQKQNSESLTVKQATGEAPYSLSREPLLKAFYGREVHRVSVAFEKNINQTGWDGKWKAKK